MRSGAGPEWWTAVPPLRVSHLAGVDSELLRLALDPLPPSAPAVVAYRPTRGLSLASLVTVLLDELEDAARALFPRWLPGAARLDGRGRLGATAARELAIRVAARSEHFGPFLADLAERALGQPGGSGPQGPGEDRRRARPSRFPAEVRAAGLTRVLADAYDRESCVLVAESPQGAGPEDERALVAAAEWLVQHGRCAVWLVGPLPHGADRVRPVPLRLPIHLAELTGGIGRVSDSPAGPGVVGLSYPPLAGAPRPDSAAEQALERALAPHDWARGRRWNHTYEWHPLGRPYRLDLLWTVEGLAVEVDGPEHRGAIMFADDRRRDVQLQLRGLDVLRFTNEQVLTDVQAVIRCIRDLLARRRAAGAHP
ncbi:endonuclease domain-containing protein [Micromonospora sp. NBC_01405]|uniref:endonuclease domain-containing protein n=1 Tax=Micromonospora sp. NBC_01405 TaxID=2903589 RepID=UPI0032518DE6